ncbi:MAG: hypothetical protein V2A74_00865 [bacterium]
MREAGIEERQGRTVEGAVEYGRRVYECRVCRCRRVPLDEELGLDLGEHLTHGVVGKVAYAVAKESFAEASATLQRLAGLSVSPAECARVAEAEGRRADARQREHEAQVLEAVRRDAPVSVAGWDCERAVVEADATSVLTVAGEEHKSVYAATAFPLEARGQKDDSGRPFLERRAYTASAVDFEDFSQRLKALVAGCRGRRRPKEMAFIGDGAPSLWKWAQENLPKTTVFIQDFWHVIERLEDLVQDVWGARDIKRLERWRQLLHDSQVADLIDELEDERKKRRGKKRERFEEELHYPRAGAERMDYARYEREGWPIGSGAVEGTCKHLVKQRFALTGARWRRSRIPWMLALRLELFNGAWEDPDEELIAA